LIKYFSRLDYKNFVPYKENKHTYCFPLLILIITLTILYKAQKAYYKTKGKFIRWLMLMRRKRSARKKKMRKKALYQTASLISIAAFGIAQVIPTSNAAFSYSASLKDGQIEAAFVFPETIEGILLEINTQMEKIHASREQADIIYEKLHTLKVPSKPLVKISLMKCYWILKLHKKQL